MSLLGAWLAALGALAIFDGLWLGLIARNFYKTSLGSSLRERPNWPVASMFYLLHALGIAVFPLSLATGWALALLYGGLFGACVFAAYDLTNLATLRNWPARLSLVDLGWGTFSTALATAAAWFVRGVAA